MSKLDQTSRRPDRSDGMTDTPTTIEKRAWKLAHAMVNVSSEEAGDLGGVMFSSHEPTTKSAIEAWELSTRYHSRGDAIRAAIDIRKWIVAAIRAVVEPLQQKLFDETKRTEQLEADLIVTCPRCQGKGHENPVCTCCNGSTDARSAIKFLEEENAKLRQQLAAPSPAAKTRRDSTEERTEPMIYRTETRIDEDWLRELMADELQHRTTTAAIRAIMEQQLSARDAEIERLRSQIRHCDNCGGSWLDDGINSGCACVAVKAEREGSEHQRHADNELLLRCLLQGTAIVWREPPHNRPWLVVVNRHVFWSGSLNSFDPRTSCPLLTKEIRKALADSLGEPVTTLKEPQP